MNGCQFVLDAVNRTRVRDHINLSELLSFGEAEHIVTHDHPLAVEPLGDPQRPLVGTDSQVVAAAVAKGRSASPKLNGTLRT